jgi:hypothetical protein
MKKKEVVRDYKFSDGTLVAKGLEKIAFIKRDKVEFDKFFVTEEKREALAAEINDFSDRDTDVEALQDQVESTESKDKKAEDVRVAIRDIMSCVELKFSVNSAKYRKFGTETLSRQTDAELFVTAKRVVRVGTDLLSDLEEHGLTAAQLTELSNLAVQFIDLMVVQRVEVGDRDIKQEDRVEAGNNIYSQLIKYTNLGQSIWVNKDVAKYNDYVMYNTITGEAPEDVVTV